MSPSLERRAVMIAAIGVILAALGMFGSVMYWAISSSTTAAQTSASMITVNARLDRIFEKLDAFPVLAEQVRQLQAQVAGAQGGYATLVMRLNAMEQNNEATHVEASKALGRKP